MGPLGATVLGLALLRVPGAVRLWTPFIYGGSHIKACGSQFRCWPEIMGLLPWQPGEMWDTSWGAEHKVCGLPPPW